MPANGYIYYDLWYYTNKLFLLTLYIYQYIKHRYLKYHLVNDCIHLDVVLDVVLYDVYHLTLQVDIYVLEVLVEQYIFIKIQMEMEQQMEMMAIMN